MQNCSVLVVDDEADMVRTCRKVLERRSYTVLTASDGPEALEILHRQPVEIAVLDLRLPTMCGMDVMREAHQLRPETVIIIMTAYATLDAAISAVRDGAFDYLSKPFTMEQLEVTVDRGAAHWKLTEQNRQLQQELRSRYQFDQVVAQSPQMTAVLDLVRKVAGTEANVLVRGESGAGKELIARCLHAASVRSQHPFVPLDCASVPETLLESELFGYERGAFTGAVTSRTGLLASASSGTLFLDEIGDLSLNLQAKLLRVLQERQFRRVGGRELLEVDIRLISATNRNLDEMLRQGTFREDLFYRLNVVSIELPPLRARPSDIALLAEFFLEQCPDSARKGVAGISSAAMMMMQNYRWPGNVRELKNVICRAVSVTEGNQINPLDLPPEMIAKLTDVHRPRGAFRQAKLQVIERFEKDFFERLLIEAGGNVSRAARQAGMKRSALHRFLRKHSLHPAAYRREPPVA